MNDAELRRSIVRVTAGDATGTGFVVARGQLLTCQHVVAGAGTRTVWVGSVPTPVDDVTLPPMQADRPVFDLAVLHAAVPGLPAVDLDTTPPEPGDEFFTFGFTDMYPQGDSALFVFEGPSVERDEQLYRLRSAQARPGLSGAPLLSRRTKRVVGVVSRSRDKDSDLGARAVPIGTALRLLPGLAPTATESANDERAHLARLIAIHEGNVRVLETQVAGYGALDVPMYKQTQLDYERAEVARLRSRLEGSP